MTPRARSLRFKHSLHGLVMALAMLGCVQPTQAEDIVMRPRPDTAKGLESDFNGAVIEEALKRTQKRYGAPKYAERVPIFTRDRLLEEMIRGEEINITVVATQPLWEEKLLTIRIPIDMGLSGYRISLIHRDSQASLSAVRTRTDLQQLKLGAGAAWSSRKVFDAEGFNVVTGDSYDALLKMLLSGRSDYFPRGLNEAFPEYDARKADYPDLAIEKDLVLELPLPTYVFVSPKAPQLARRVEEGMELMVRDGSLLKMTLKFNAEMLTQANLCSRRVFHIANPLLTDKTPVKRKELWFDPYDKKNGICTSRVKAGSRKSEE